MIIHFDKMQGLGNDFMVVDGLSQHWEPTVDEIKRLSNRHFGIGFDQLLLIKQSQDSADIFFQIFNADGSEVQQCGNGARCVARFARNHGLIDQGDVLLRTAAGQYRATVDGEKNVTVSMGCPIFSPEEIPFKTAKEDNPHVLQTEQGNFEVTVVNMGNPHAIVIIDAFDKTQLDNWGAAIGAHPDFTQGVNVGFVHIIDQHKIELVTYERGVGKTLACGSSACAAVVSSILQGHCQDEVLVSMPGGDLTIAWTGKADDAVHMTGPANTVFTGTISL